jgi:protein SCO1
VLLASLPTTCTTICPVMSTAFSRVPAKLGAEAGKLRMISVSVDPENDKPAQLKDYAGHFGAGANWQFFTGSAADVETMLRAFDNYHADKMDYGPLTFLRPAPGKPWVRINGIASAEDLVREYRSVVPN